MGPRATLDAVVKREIPSPRRESNPRTPIVQPVAQRYTDYNNKYNSYTTMDTVFTASGLSPCTGNIFLE
jgi:hypothetical protein